MRYCYTADPDFRFSVRVFSGASRILIGVRGEAALRIPTVDPARNVIVLIVAEVQQEAGELHPDFTATSASHLPCTGSPGHDCNERGTGFEPDS